MSSKVIVLGEGRIRIVTTMQPDDSALVTLYRMPKGCSLDDYKENPRDIVATFKVLATHNDLFSKELAAATAKAKAVADAKEKLAAARLGQTG